MISVKELMSNELFLFDSDGCLVEEGVPLPGAIALISLLKKFNKKIILFTNNSTSHPDDVAVKYRKQGFEIDEVINSGRLTVEFCLAQKMDSVYVIGEEGLVKILTQNNIEVKDIDDSVDAVIVGMDRTLTYEKLAIATRLIRRGARFIATNPDPSFPTPRGLEPGAGSMISALMAATDVEPEIIIGKPNPWGYKLILKRYNLNSDKAVMFGDRFETDILGAREAGMHGVLVGTGISGSRDRGEEKRKLINEMYISNLEELVELIGNTNI